MTVLLGVIAVFAILSLVVAASQARAIMRLAPASAELGAFMVLGWWKFGKLEAKAGPAAAANLQIYKRATIAFLVFILLGVMLSGWAVSQRPAASDTAAVTGAVAGRVVSVSLIAFNTDLRRVAMPGATLLES
ncbi:hypothetical protein [Devosia sp. FKR38]|uniref:hypothetical protein n=1 Tax=Devosia sp. FKR38 TaxID=2562312 RepID=UPI0010BF8FBD|nr:hypothetical protein [Devosia sp. FKR38]